MLFSIGWYFLLTRLPTRHSPAQYIIQDNAHKFVSEIPQKINLPAAYQRDKVVKGTACRQFVVHDDLSRRLRRGR